MFNKIIFLLICLCILGQSCDTSPKQVQTTDSGKTLPKDYSMRHDLISQVKNIDSAQVEQCSDILPRKGVDYIRKIYFDTMTFDNMPLLCVTRDSNFLIYSQKNSSCTLIFKIPIDSTDLYKYTDGSPLFLQDIDDDNQKEVFVTIYRNKGNSTFRVYRLIHNDGQMALVKIMKLEEVINPEYDKSTRLIRSHWYDKDNYEVDEYYKITQDDRLVFVKGFKHSNGKDEHYTTKQGW